MLHTIDTEFWEHGREHPIELISLGIRSEDGRTYYAVNSEFDWSLYDKAVARGETDDWLARNVKPNLSDPRVQNDPVIPLRTYKQLKTELIRYFERDKKPEIWGYFADYDWVLFCQIFGRMIDLPKNFPQMCLDVNQERKSFGFSRDIFPPQDRTEHNALNDANWTMDCVRAVMVKKQALLDRLGTGTV